MASESKKEQILLRENLQRYEELIVTKGIDHNETTEFLKQASASSKDFADTAEAIYVFMRLKLEGNQSKDPKVQKYLRDRRQKDRETFER